MAQRKRTGTAIHHFTYTQTRRRQIKLAVSDFKIKGSAFLNKP